MVEVSPNPEQKPGQYVKGFGNFDVNNETLDEQRARLQQRAGKFESSNSDDDDVGEYDWTVTYTDMVTLLMAFFVILTSLAMATPVETQSIGIQTETKAVTEGPSSPFDGRGITIAQDGMPANRDPVISRYDDPDATASTTDPSPSGEADTTYEVKPPSTGPLTTPPPPEKFPEPTPDNAENKALAGRLKQMVQQNNLGSQVEVLSGADTVTLRISDRILFSSGRADLETGGQALVARLTPILSQSGGEISVEGHTDNIPISTALYPSNWELSAARAAMVLRQLVALGLPSERMRAIAYAETKPVGDNASPDHRAANRRVEIVISSGAPKP